MFPKILNKPLAGMTTCTKNSISDPWQSFEFAFSASSYFHKKIHLNPFMMEVVII